MKKLLITILFIFSFINICAFTIDLMYKWVISEHKDML